MSLSYSGITNYGKVTLPSVSGGLGSLHVVKDPPKSIHTRRKDRVGQTMDHVQMIEDSSSRASESIRQYALGVNPMVSISYSNHGNNGGQGLLNRDSSAYNRSAYNPYSLGAAGFQFRPPVRKPQELLPLSRQPRTNTTFSTNPEMIDWSKRLACPSANDLKKEIIMNTLRISAQPNEKFVIEKPIEEPFEVKYVIQNPTRVSTSAGMRTRDIKDRGDVLVPRGGIEETTLNAYAQANVSDGRTYLTEFDVFTDKYIQEHQTSNVQTNKGRRMDNTADDMDLDMNVYIKDKISSNISTNKGIRINNLAGEHEDIDIGMYIKDKVTHIDYVVPSILSKETDHMHAHNNRYLQRSLPQTSAYSNITKNVHKVTTIPKELELEPKTPLASAQSNAVYGSYRNESSRDKYLPPRTHRGGFDNAGFIPSSTSIIQRRSDPDVHDQSHMSEKTKLFKKAAAQFEGRYSVLPPMKA